jgi:hypothetical protein
MKTFHNLTAQTIQSVQSLGSNSRASTVGSNRTFLSSPPRPDGLWGPPNLLYNYENDQSYAPNTKAKNVYICTSVSHTPSGCDA